MAMTRSSTAYAVKLRIVNDSVVVPGRCLTAWPPIAFAVAPATCIRPQDCALVPYARPTQLPPPLTDGTWAELRPRRFAAANGPSDEFHEGTHSKDSRIGSVDRGKCDARTVRPCARYAKPDR